MPLLENGMHGEHLCLLISLKLLMLLILLKGQPLEEKILVEKNLPQENLKLRVTMLLLNHLKSIQTREEKALQEVIGIPLQLTLVVQLWGEPEWVLEVLPTTMLIWIVQALVTLPDHLEAEIEVIILLLIQVICHLDASMMLKIL